jgi:hypothetical protein
MVRHQESTPEASPECTTSLARSITHVFHKIVPSNFGHCSVREGTFPAARCATVWTARSAAIVFLPVWPPTTRPHIISRRSNAPLICYPDELALAYRRILGWLFALAIVRRGMTVGPHPGDAGHDGLDPLVCSLGAAHLFVAPEWSIGSRAVARDLGTLSASRWRDGDASGDSEDQQRETRGNRE